MTDTPVLRDMEIAYAELDPAGELGPAERTRLARELVAKRTRKAEEELAEIGDRSPIAASDWRWPAILQRTKAAADHWHFDRWREQERFDHPARVAPAMTEATEEQRRNVALAQARRRSR